jgi:GT2 family glycosyltransferase
MDYIARLHAVAQATGAMVVGGVQRATAPHGRAWQRAIAIAMNSPCGAGPASHRLGNRSGPTDNVYLGLYRRSVFDTVGYFDEESPIISEECDLHHRVIKAGGRVWLIADMAIAYEPRALLKDQFWLYYRYGAAKSAFIIKYGELTTLRQLIAPSFWVAVLALATLSLIWHPALWALGALLAAYTVGILGCAGLEGVRAGQFSLAPLVATVAAAMQLGYALGYVKKLLIKDPPGHFWDG